MLEINFPFPQLWSGLKSILGFTGKAFACELEALDLCTHDALSVKPKNRLTCFCWSDKIQFVKPASCTYTQQFPLDVCKQSVF